MSIRSQPEHQVQSHVPACAVTGHPARVCGVCPQARPRSPTPIPFCFAVRMLSPGGLPRAQGLTPLRQILGEEDQVSGLKGGGGMASGFQNESPSHRIRSCQLSGLSLERCSSLVPVTEVMPAALGRVSQAP